jgi:GTP-binding protein
VVLTGRPNVGKSTLFNRLLHKRRAITDPTPGVTRDPVAQETFIRGKRLRLIDTGGFKLDRGGTDDELDAIVVERTLETIKKADLIILILEAGELKSEDEEFIEILRPYQKRLIVAVNKTEGGRREAEAWNVLSSGFDKIYMISAEHGDNVGELETAIVDFFHGNNVDEAAGEDGAENFSPEYMPETRPIRIAILGKPNTGKSTLSNRLTASAASIVSDIPGTTRDVVEGRFTWKNRNFQVLDTAGIRRKTKVNENIEYYSVNRAIKTIDEADIVFLVIDAQEGLSDQDKKIAALAHDKGRGIIMVLNKWDAIPRIKNTFEAVRDRIHFLFGKMEYAPILPVSAKDGSGVDVLLSTAIRMYAQLNIQIETAALNEALEKWLEEYPPPVGPHTRFKVKYAVQSQANPVRFIFFVSRKHAVGEPYIAYLRNKIRKDLGFSLIPVEIELRQSADSAAAKHSSTKKSSRRNRSTPFK